MGAEDLAGAALPASMVRAPSRASILPLPLHHHRLLRHRIHLAKRHCHRLRRRPRLRQGRLRPACNAMAMTMHVALHSRVFFAREAVTAILTRTALEEPSAGPTIAVIFVATLAG